MSPSPYSLTKSADRSVKFEVRYARSFLLDLQSLEPAAYQRVYDFVFVEFMQLKRLYDLPQLRQVGAEGIFYRFAIDDYIVAIEVTGQIVKFLRILPKPNI